MTLALAALPALAEPGCAGRLGSGWPAATGNYGSAVETLFQGQATPVLSMVMLPARGVESGLAILPAAEGRWVVRSSRADKRVYSESTNARSFGVQLRVEQEPEQHEVAIPAALVQRLRALWPQALAAQAGPAGSAPFVEGDVLSFTADGQRFSGPPLQCRSGRLLMEQAELLVRASETKEKKLERRWNDLEASLDELQTLLAGTTG